MSLAATFKVMFSLKIKVTTWHVGTVSLAFRLIAIAEKVMMWCRGVFSDVLGRSTVVANVSEVLETW
jgi:hypothetical protein